MFEFEESNGLHDVFLNKHAVSCKKQFRAPNFQNKEKIKIFIKIHHTLIHTTTIHTRNTMCKIPKWPWMCLCAFAGYREVI